MRQGVQVAQQSSQFGVTSGGASGDFEQFLAGFAGKHNNGSLFTTYYFSIRQVFVYSGEGIKVSTHRKITIYSGNRNMEWLKLRVLQQEDDISLVVPDGPAKPSEEELAQQREQEIGSLQEELAELVGQVEGMQLDIKKFTSNMQQVCESCY